MMDVIRLGEVSPKESMRVVAMDDRGAIVEATAIFSRFVNDQNVTGFRIREPKPKRGTDRAVHSYRKPN
jgi:hypothetical protein